MRNEDCFWLNRLRLSGFLHPIVCLSFGRGVWGRMSDYLRALKALGWLNINTDYRANNISEDFPQSYKECVGGMFVLSKLSIMDSIDFRTGKELIKIAEWEGWKDE
jgi:hypothetical protein